MRGTFQLVRSTGSVYKLGLALVVWRCRLLQVRGSARLTPASCLSLRTDRRRSRPLLQCLTMVTACCPNNYLLCIRCRKGEPQRVRKISLCALTNVRFGCTFWGTTRLVQPLWGLRFRPDRCHPVRPVCFQEHIKYMERAVIRSLSPRRW